MGVAVVQIVYNTHTCGVSGYPTRVRTITYIYTFKVSVGSKTKLREGYSLTCLFPLKYLRNMLS